MTTPKILVTGADGQLGKCIQRISHSLPGEFVFATRSQLDITDQAKIKQVFALHRFQYCINAAAYTKVDQAEKEQALAYAINVDGPRFLAEECAAHKCTLIHISSDYVYHNGLTRPLKEDDPVSPASVYARTKLDGEQQAQRANPKTTILRTSWLFSEYGHNFVKTMARLMKERKPLRIVNDQIGCPTYAGDLAQAILRIISVLLEDDSRDELYGIFNYCNEGQTTWYDFAREIAKQLGVQAEITPTSSVAYGAAAARPPYSVLDTSKLRRIYGVEIPHWNKGLKLVLDHL